MRQLQYVLITVGIFFNSVVCKSQNLPYAQDALLFSSTDFSYASSARFRAVGAQIALGADLSSAAINPAGLGFYNKSDFSMTSAIDFINTDSEYFGNSTTSFKSNFNIPNIGVALNFNKGRFTSDKFKGGTLAITINRQQSFHSDVSYLARNEGSSIADSFADDATLLGYVPNNEDDLLYQAYINYLISPVSYDVVGTDTLYNYVADFSGFPTQSNNVEERGSTYQMNIAWGGNYDDRLYFGGGMGVQFLNYRQNTTYEEYNFQEPNSDIPDDRLANIFLAEQLSIEGIGVNFNAGVIFKPVQFISIGASYTSPSFLTLRDTSFYDFDVEWRDGAEYVDAFTGETEAIPDEPIYLSNIFFSKYQLRTPSKLGLGGSIFLGKSGFLSGDIEFVDYTASRIKSNELPVSEVSDNNDGIEDLYKDVINVRVGGEFRAGNMRLRAGYALFPSPYRGSNLQERTSVSFGIGYRNPDYYIDLALVNSETRVLYSPYSTFAEQPVATTDVNRTSASITFGFLF